MIYKGKDTLKVIQYISDKYGANIEFLWESTPSNGIFRHQANAKWFAALLEVPKVKLGLQGDESVEILDLKCDPTLVELLKSRDNYFAAYHMNKKHWITLLLNASIPIEEVYQLIDESYEITK